MEILMLWICASAAMDDCRASPISKPVPHERCEDLKKLNAAILGTGPEQNYRLDCDPVD